jgi:hypothetical protein
MKKEPPKKKKVLQDVVPPTRSIRNVGVPPRARRIQEITKEEIVASHLTKVPKNKAAAEVAHSAPVRREHAAPVSDIVVRASQEESVEASALGSFSRIEAEEETSFSYEYDGPPKKKSHKMLYGSVGLFLLAFAFGISALFKSAEVRIQPRRETKDFSETFSAQKDDTGAALGFQVVTVTKDTEETVQASGTQKVEQKAAGRVVLYNNFSAEPQKLVATTRLQTPEGLIFRLVAPVSIPGKQKNTAGHIEVSVVADAPGASYNVGLKDFTIPGFKGDPKYSQIYGRSKTPMTGGASGIQKVVSADTLAQAEKDLEASLKESLAKDIVTQIPANFIMYPGGLDYSFEPATQAPIPGTADAASSGSAILSKKGTVNAIIFDRGALSRAIIEKVLATSTSDAIKVTNLDSFAFAYPDGTSVSTASPDIAFTLRGTADFIWSVDENKLKSELLGLDKVQAHAMIARYPGIAESWIVTRPFWNSTIPLDNKKVTLVNTLSAIAK